MGWQTRWHILSLACCPHTPRETNSCFPHLTGHVVGVCLAWLMLVMTNSELHSRGLAGICHLNKEFRGQT